MLKITIDGKTTEVKKGTTVLNAARQLGIDIPTLCDHPELSPYGGCRLCLVEVEGAHTLQPSCTLPVSDNMIVTTDTEKIHEARKFILSMLFSERNHFCPYCQVSGGDCELQNSAYDEGMTHWPIQPNWQPYPVDASHPFIILEHNRCILCRRCVRACGELVGNFTLGFEERGADSTLVADLGLPLGESSCIGCGTCVQVCPTGTLIDRWSAYQGKETEVDVTKTICLGCSLGCGIDVLTRDNRLVRIEGDWDAEVNEGVICEVGRFIPMVEERERILTPMVRTNGKMKAATWEDALSAAATILKQNKGKLSAVASTRLSMEALEQLKTICEAFEARSITSTEECGAISEIFKLSAATGANFEAKLDDIKNADCYLFIGEDTTKDHQVISFFAKRQLPFGSKLIQITENESGFDNFATDSLKIGKKSLAEFLAFMNSLISDKDKDIAAAAKKFKLDVDALTDAISALKNANKVALIIGSRYPFENTDMVVKNAIDLGVALKAKIISTKGNINSVGASILGMNAVSEDEVPGVVVMALADEELTQSFSNIYEKVEKSVVFSSYVSSLTAAADVVFPVQNWLEQEGHYINIDGRILKAEKALEAPDSTLSNEMSFKKLAGELGLKVKSEWAGIAKQASAPVAIK